METQPPATDPEETPQPPTSESPIVELTAKRRSFAWPFNRDGQDRYLGGVAGGLGHRYGFDPFFFRLALLGGALLMRGGPYALLPLAYVAAWLLVPLPEQKPLLWDLKTKSSLQEAGGATIALILGLLVLDRPSMIVPGALLAGAALLLSSTRPDTERSPMVARGGQGPDSAGSGDQAERAGEVVSPETGQQQKALAWGQSLRRGLRGPLYGQPRIARRIKREPALWPLTLALLAALAVLSVVVDSTIAGGVDPGLVVNIALLIIGAVIVLAAWRGRAKTTALLALPLLPLWIAFSVADIGRFQGNGQLTAAPEQASAGQLSYERGFGELILDARRLPLEAGSETTLRVDITAGIARVTVPYDVNVEVRTKLGLGLLEVRAPQQYRIDREAGISRTTNLSYPALGNECSTWAMPATQLSDFAAANGISVLGTGSDTERIADAIEAAGYPKPVKVSTEVYSRTGEQVFASDGAPIEFEPLTEDAVFENENGEPFAPGQIERTDYWDTSVDQNGQLCAPSGPPENPATVVIEGNIGLGTLEIIRD